MDFYHFREFARRRLVVDAIAIFGQLAEAKVSLANCEMVLRASRSSELLLVDLIIKILRLVIIKAIVDFQMFLEFHIIVTI